MFFANPPNEIKLELVLGPEAVVAYDSSAVVKVSPRASQVIERVWNRVCKKVSIEHASIGGNYRCIHQIR